MATTGIGYRTAVDVLCEISLHLVEEIVNTTITSVGTPGGYGSGGYGQYGYGSGPPAVIRVPSTVGMYVGAEVVVGYGLTDAEVATITQVGNGFFATSLVNTHAAGETILGATFPTQQPTDPFFTQEEMLGYLSRAQNEFLSDCPIAYQLSYQNLSYGQLLQSTPSNCIEINRIAATQYFCVITSITRTSNVATAVTASPHGLVVNSTIFIQNATAGFGGVFQVTGVPSATSFTYRQVAANGSATGGAVLYFNRMYETTQAEISMTDRTWRNNYANVPTNWYEDRSGLYRWGVGAKPSSNFPVEMLCSVRDTDILDFLDGFLVPDLLIFAVKFKVLEYAFSKNGTQQDPQRAAYCGQRYQKAVAATERFLEGYQMSMEKTR